MSAQAVRAVYEQGRLRLLDVVDLTEGQEIQRVILSQRERVRAALGDMLVRYVPDAGLAEPVDESALLAEIDATFRGKPAISDVIIEERREGP